MYSSNRMKYIKFEAKYCDMITKSKLRGPIGRAYPIAVILTYIFVAIEIMIKHWMNNNGYFITTVPIIATCTFAVFFVVMGIIQTMRYKLWVYLILGVLFGIGTFLSMAHYLSTFFNLGMYIINFLVIALLVVIFWSTLYSQERLEINTRRLFKLAVSIIVDVSEGYTNRPLSYGKLDYTQDELFGFINYIKSNYIGTVITRDSINYITFSLGTSTLVGLNPDKYSYVSFDNTGKVAVNIFEYDYNQYKQKYSFDQLCNTMGEVMVRFLDYYIDGHESRIKTDLKSVK